MKTKKAVLFIIILFFMFWLLAIARCEVMTILYGDNFREIYKEDTMIGDNVKMKVLSYSGEKAKVYYVSIDENNLDLCGDIVTFKNENGVWEFSVWETVWSRFGSADGFVFPYIR